MKKYDVICPNCKAALDPQSIESDRLARCPACASEISTTLYPAVYRWQDSYSSGASKLDGESSCFYHADRKAVAICEVSGRFLCSLCDIEISGKHYSPEVVSREIKEGELKHLKKGARLDDGIALGLALVPLTMVGLYFFWITAPVSIFFGVRAIRKQESLLPRSTWRAWVAIVLSVFQLLGLLFFIFALVAGFASGFSGENEPDTINQEETVEP